jgi:ABC-type transport system substrate-binding protein
MKNFSNSIKIKKPFAILKRFFDPNFLEYLWPIRWQVFKPSKNILLAFFGADKFLKFSLVIFLVGFLGSFYLFSLGVWVVATREVADNGGTFYEGFLQNSLSHLNPVLEISSDLESKAIDLLYEPLYRVKLPDFIKSKDIEIEPVLLAKKPTWQDMEKPAPIDRYKILRFTLRPDLKWSDGSNLTVKDIRYTFERLKESTGNSQFRQSMEGVEIVAIGNSEYEFELRTNNSNPQMIFNANFSPISEKYFNTLKNEQIQQGRAMSAMVTSGPMKILPNYTDNSQTKPNPTFLANGRFDKLIFTRNDNANFRKTNLDKIIFQNYETVEEIGNSKSLENAVKNENLDLFTRFLPGSSVKSVDVLNKLQVANQDNSPEVTGFSQKIIPTNIYYSIFLNLKKSSDGYFINQNLRRYLICSLYNWQHTDEFLEKLPKDRKIIPVQLGVGATPDCPDTQEEIENNLKEALSSDKLKIYTFGENKQVLIFGKPFQLTMVTTLDSQNGILLELKDFFQSIGLPLNIINESSQVKTLLESSEKNFNLSFLPNLTGSDPYPLFGLKGKDLLQTTLNERVKDYNFEENLTKYSQSNFGDVGSLKVLTDFFGKEYVMFNLGRGLQEINYSNRIKGISFDHLGIYNFGSDLYIKIPEWYWQTKRVF